MTAPMTPERRAEIDHALDGNNWWAIGSGDHLNIAEDLRAECDRLAGEVERMRAVCDAARDEKRHADRIRNPAILDKDSPYSDYRKAVERLRDAVAALDAKEPTP